MYKRFWISCVALLVGGVALAASAVPVGARAVHRPAAQVHRPAAQVDNRLVGIWYAPLKGKKGKKATHVFWAFFPKGRLVAYSSTGATVTMRWARQGNQLAFTGPSALWVYTFSIKQVARVVGGRRVSRRVLTMRDSKGGVSGWTSAQFGLLGRLKGSYCAWDGSSQSSRAFLSSYSKTFRYRFDGRGRVRYTASVTIKSYSKSSSGHNVARDSSKSSKGLYLVMGKDVALMWPSGAVDFATLSGRVRKGRAAYLTFGSRRYDPGLCK